MDLEGLPAQLQLLDDMQAGPQLEDYPRGTDAPVLQAANFFSVFVMLWTLEQSTMCGRNS